MSERCPTCGAAVTVHQSSEGTGCYVPVQSEAERVLREWGLAMDAFWTHMGKDDSDRLVAAEYGIRKLARKLAEGGE